MECYIQGFVKTKHDCVLLFFWSRWLVQSCGSSYGGCTYVTDEDVVLIGKKTFILGLSRKKAKHLHYVDGLLLLVPKARGRQTQRFDYVSLSS